MTNKPDRMKGQLTEFHRKALARMVVEGCWSRQQMAAVLRRDPTTIDRYIDHDAETQRFIDEYEGVVIQGMVDSRFRMLDLSDQAFRVVENDLRGGDPKLAHDSAWKVLDRLVPKAGDRPLGQQPDQVQVDPRGQQVVVEAFIGLAKVVKQATDEGAFQGNYRKSIRTGPEALPGPGGSVVDVEMGEDDAPAQ